jgi:four helix bundle protein
MATELEDLKVLQLAEGVADAIWKQVGTWEEFARDVVGKQIARASDSIGANIAESFGRFNYGEKIQFLYYARGSLFETKYWLNRSLARKLMEDTEVRGYVSQLTELARQLNTFVSSLKSQRTGEVKPQKSVRELPASYDASSPADFPDVLFTERDLVWLQS